MLMLTEEFIQRELTMKAAIELVERAFIADARGEAVAFPPVVDTVGQAHAHFGIKSGFLRLTDAGQPREILGLKAGGYWKHNAERHGLPNHRATILLVDPERGEPLALMPANVITRLRTAAAGALAARCLARPDASTVAILGTGDQAHAQLEALRETHRIAKAFVWGRRAAAVEDYIQAWRGSGIELHAAGDLATCLPQADIVVTTTPSTSPIVMDEWIRPGTHINAVGSDGAGKRELDPELVRRAKVVPDKSFQSRSIGELQDVAPRPDGRDLVHAELGQVCCGIRPGRTSDEDITVFDSSGIGLQDLVVASHLVQRATRQLS